MTVLDDEEHDASLWCSDSQLLGKGGFGSVYACNDLVCVKVQNKDDDQMVQEKSVYDLLSHEEQAPFFLPRFISSGVLGDSRYLVMERLEIDLHHFIIQSKEQLYHIIHDVICGLEFLHTHHIAHADLKPHNLMLDIDGHVRLIDLGLSVSFTDADGTHLPFKSTTSMAHRGTLLYISEDAHRGVVPSRRSDLENLGWVIVDLMIKTRESHRHTIPWINVRNKNQIMLEKIMVKNNLKASLKKILHGHSWSRIESFFRHVVSLDYETVPDYASLKHLFVKT